VDDLPFQALGALAVARAPVGAQEIEGYLHAVALENGMFYAKIFCITDIGDVLSPENIAALGDIVRRYALYGPIGPVAIVAPFDRGYRQARLFADAAQVERPLAIFPRAARGAALDRQRDRPPAATPRSAAATSLTMRLQAAAVTSRARVAITSGAS
jgi:hypothetical protein